MVLVLPDCPDLDSRQVLAGGVAFGAADGLHPVRVVTGLGPEAVGIQRTTQRASGCLGLHITNRQCADHKAELSCVMAGFVRTVAISDDKPLVSGNAWLTCPLAPGSRSRSLTQRSLKARAVRACSFAAYWAAGGLGVAEVFGGEDLREGAFGAGVGRAWVTRFSKFAIFVEAAPLLTGGREPVPRRPRPEHTPTAS